MAFKTVKVWVGFDMGKVLQILIISESFKFIIFKSFENLESFGSFDSLDGFEIFENLGYFDSQAF